MDRTRLEQTLSFPSPFTFRVIADSSDDLGRRCAAAVEGALGRAAARVEDHPSPSGRYRTVRVFATVHDADEVVRAYEALGAVPGLRMLL